MGNDNSFATAYNLWSGEKWKWKNDDGTINHPIDSQDETVRAFYLGFSYCKRESKKLTEELDSVPDLKRRIIKLENDIKTFRKIK